MSINSPVFLPQKIIGILGGMGPMAGIDMLTKFIRQSSNLGKATSDQTHIPIILSNLPDVPDRSAYLLNNGQDPYPHILSYAKNLQNAGAGCLVIACNTAHYWFERLQSDLPDLVMISMIDATVQSIMTSHHRNIGILATDATLATSLYKDKILNAGLNYIEPKDDDQKFIMQSIYLYKSGNTQDATTLLHTQKQKLMEQGADAIIMGCTEVPLILSEDLKRFSQHYVDATQCLVDKTIQWYYS